MDHLTNIGLTFEAVVNEHGNKIALLYPECGRQITYIELSELAGRIATQLVVRGGKRGDVVGIFHDKSPGAYATMLACVRVGLVYTNLDPQSPMERLRKIVANCRPYLIVDCFADSERSKDQALGCKVVKLDRVMEVLNNEQYEKPEVSEINGSAPAYIMYTSGSTGFPKGAVISHANLLSFIVWCQARFDISSRDIITNLNPMYFDNSVFDFYTALLTGATLVPIKNEQLREPRTLVGLVEKANSTIWFSVPSLLVYLLTVRALDKDSLPNIRKIVFGGEGFPKPKLRLLYDIFSQRAILENVYGPTECTCICSAHSIVPEDFADMSSLATIGKLSRNFEGVIMPLLESDPEFGELVLLGTQVGLGYYNDGERTEHSFIQNPRNACYRDIGYRTGDLVRRDKDGRLHFKGRADFQIKHMGYRVELEEIEAAISTIDGVDECGVTYNIMEGGIGEIVAFASGDQELQSEWLSKQVASIIPAYMVPKKFWILDCLPKNANGKIDRLALLSIAKQ